MLEIIGPGRITYEHKKEILFQTSELERRVREVDSEFDKVCADATRFASDMRAKLEAYMTLNNINDKITIIPVNRMMSEYSSSIVREFDVPMHKEVDGEYHPLELTEFQRVFLFDLDEHYAIGRMTFDKAFEELRERQAYAYQALLRKTMVEEFFHQDSMGFGNIILYLDNHDEQTFDRHALDLTHMLAPQLERAAGQSRFRSPFNPTRWNVRKLRREAERKGAAVYVVSHFSDMINPKLLLEYTAQMLQDRYVQPHKRSMFRHERGGPSHPQLFICKTDQGQVYGVKVGEFDLNPKLVSILMETEDRDDMI